MLDLLGRDGAHANARMRFLSRNCSSALEEIELVCAVVLLEKYSLSALLIKSLRFQLDSSWSLPSADQIESTRFDVSTARAHRRCLARPGGDQAIAIGTLGDISSPIEKFDNGAGFLSGSSSLENQGT